MGGSTFQANGTGTKDKKSRFGLSHGQNSSAFTNSRNDTSTFASDNYGMTSSNFGSNSQSLGVGINRVPVPRGPTKGFTNRLTEGDLEGEREEWEMSTKSGSGSGGGKEEEGALAESPTTPEGKYDSEIELRSTAQLNRQMYLGNAV